NVKNLFIAVIIFFIWNNKKISIFSTAKDSIFCAHFSGRKNFLFGNVGIKYQQNLLLPVKALPQSAKNATFAPSATLLQREQKKFLNSELADAA
ncbi:MAG: hypothetical protein LBB79_04600, partial [Prevotellaceae bacterium]|nr:hypothetical protein [Prevotellaceae bacterium]